MLKLCVNTQTPLVGFITTDNWRAHNRKTDNGCVSLSSMKEGKDYKFSPGGVTRMVFPLLKYMMARGKIYQSHWVSLNPTAPQKAVLDEITLVSVVLKPEKMRGYGFVKEAIWGEIHGIPKKPLSIASLVWSNKFSDYTQYNRLCSETIRRLDEEEDFDVFYIHDFQQLLTGMMLDTLKPKIFRWHIPLDEASLSLEWRRFLSKHLRRFSTVIVSSKKYLNILKRIGYEGSAHYVYPYVDPQDYGRPSKQQLDRFCAKFKIFDSDKMILVVARLDPMKGQNLAIRAFTRLAKKMPNIKLVLAGNGSFSSSKRGLGLSKASKWLAELTHLAKKLKVDDRIIFTGHLTESELQAAYSRCDITLLPSIKEGFGLVVIESWLYKKPAVVSSKAGIAELISDGENGILVDPQDVNALASVLLALLSDSDRCSSLGRRGFVDSKRCHLKEGAKKESELMMGVTEGRI